MRSAQALDLVSRYDSARNPLTSLADFPDPELIVRCLAESGTVTLRKRRLPLEMMVWCIVGMALEREEPLHQIVNLCYRETVPSWPPAQLSRPVSDREATQSVGCSHRQRIYGAALSRIPTGVV